MSDKPLRAPQQERSKRSLEAIYAAAVDLLAEGGWDAVTVGEIERRSGVSRGTFYLRFPTRDALVDYTHERILQEVREEQNRAFGDLVDGPPLSIEEAARAVVSGIGRVFARVGRVMVHFTQLAHRPSGAEAVHELSRDVKAVFGRALGDAPNADEAIRFAMELTFAAFVARQRGIPAFDGGARPASEAWSDELVRAIAAYLSAAAG